jgi:hypothetical protein
MDNTMQKNEIVRELGITNYLWYSHIRNHVQPAVTQNALEVAPDLAQDLVDVVGEVAGTVERLKNKAESMSENMSSETDPNVIKTWVAIEVALRQSVETIGKITGDLKGMNNVKQQNIKVEFNNFAGQVMQDACPVCMAKFAKTLEPIIKKIQ